MKRKLVKQGAATMMVSLPAKWIQKNGLDKGNSVEVDEKNNSIYITLEPDKAKRHATINLTSLTESSIRTAVTNAYRLGYDAITVHYSSLETLKIIQNVVKTRLIGFEIIKHDDKSCTIENITEPSKEHFENIFSKVWLNITDLFSLAESALKGKKNSDFNEIEERIQQFDNFCLRVVIKTRPMEYSELEWAFHTHLIHAQRELFLMLRYLTKKGGAHQHAADLLHECKHLFDLLQEGYHKRDIKHLERIHEKEKTLIYKEGYSSLAKAKDAVLVYHVMAAARNFYLASSPLIGLLISSRSSE